MSNYDRAGDIDSSLLRLFENEFFDAQLAVFYLHRFPSSQGIQYFLCEKLKRYPEFEVEQLLPQICHLLLSKPTQSAMFEACIFHLCAASSHLAIMMLWYIESYLPDLQLARKTNPESYHLGARIYRACQSIVFEGSPMKPALGSAIVANGLSAPLGQSVHVGAALVGMGAIFGGISTPALVKHIKAPVLIQGRQHRALYLTQTLSTSDKPPLGLSSAFTPLPSPSTAGSPSVFELADGSAFSFKSFIEKTSRRTSQIMNGQRKSGRRESKARAAAENSDDDGDLASPCLEIGHSTARLFSSERNSQSILKSHYFYSEMQFIMTLIEISDRLRSVPKSARQRSLVAELTLLNHNLPADVCIPFFCNNGVSNNRGHHKMMRIVLSDCVVLNSADRVPYLIIVEVIEPRKNDERASDSPVSVTSPTLSGKLPPKLETSVNSKCDVPKQQVTSEVAVNNVATEKDAIEIENLDAENGIDVHDSKGLPPNTSDDLASPKVNFVELSSVEDADNIVVGPEIVTGEAESPLGEECHPQVKGYDNILNENVVNTFTAPVYDFEAPSESEPRLSSEKLRVSSVMHHHTVMSRRKASFDNLGIQPETTELGRLPMGRLSISITSNHDNTFAEKMRTAAVMLAQIHQQQQKQETSDIRDKKTTTAAKDNIDDIRTKVIKEMEALEVKRLLSPMPLEGLNVDLTDLEESLVRNRNRSVSEDVDHDDPSGNGLANLAIVFRESWSVKEERVRNASPYGSEPGWKLLSFIVKSGADLRQEQLALQLIREMHKIWEIENVPVRIHNFRILVISHQSGLIETIPDAVSIHSIKRDGLQRQELPGMPYTLYDHFIKEFGEPGSATYQEAQNNFVRSLAGYSIICYLLQVKDRHNGNILVDHQGFCMHIDFGFMLCNSPGSVGFELAPFKLPQEYVDILGGVYSEKFEMFKSLLLQAFLALRKRSQSVIELVEIMEKDSTLPCFTGVTPKSHIVVNANLPEPPINLTPIPKSSSMESFTPYLVTNSLRERFHLEMTEAQVAEFIDKIVESSCNNTFTKLYDAFQYYSNGIL